MLGIIVAGVAIAAAALWKVPVPFDGDTPPIVPSTDVAPNDADRDGISNEEEKTLGLDEKEFDTDGDGVADLDELQVWKTDPKKADTDGDGFSDGVEIIYKHNPLGR